MAWEIKSENFKQPKLSILYYVIFLFAAVVCLTSTIVIPWWYDQENLKTYQEAANNNNLLVREYAAIQIKSEIDKNNSSDEPISLKEQISFSKSLQDKKLISLDYIHQMEKAKLLKNKEVKWRISFLLLFTTIVFFILLFKVKHHLLRTPLVFLTFVISLSAFWFTGDGLPHVNYKFHIIIGFIYAVILAGSDFLHTYSIEKTVDTSNPGGGLAALQYRHRFWCVILHAIILTLLTTFGTISFKTLDYFYKVFGENFVTTPLIGLSVSLVLVLFVVITGILYPIRNNIDYLEREMEKIS